MKMRIAGTAALAIALLSGAAFAQALAQPPAHSPRPDARPGSTDAAVALAMAATSPSISASPLPTLRPRVSAPVVPPAPVVLASAGTAVWVSARPGTRPVAPPHRDVVRVVVRSQPATPVATSRAGSVCGDRSIRGQTLSPIPGRLRGCGIPRPVRVTSVDGVALSQPSTLSCDAAKALKRWVSRSVKPTVGRLGGGVASLTVLAHYSCRTRNNIPGAKISEHGRGNAIDVAAINLKNGVSLDVLKGWNDPVQSRLLRKVHAEACGTFGTVLGPNSDRYHRNHFHLDVAKNRGGAYCR